MAKQSGFFVGYTWSPFIKDDRGSRVWKSCAITAKAVCMEKAELIWPLANILGLVMAQVRSLKGMTVGF